MNKKYNPTLRLIGCNFCHRLSGEKGVQLIKGKDSYYCLSCYNTLKLKEFKEEKENDKVGD